MTGKVFVRVVSEFLSVRRHDHGCRKGLAVYVVENVDG